MTNKELTELLIKHLLHEWKCTKSTTTAYDICNILCEHYRIDTNSDLTFPPIIDNERNDPLIKDDKIRKAVRAWAEANGLDDLAIYYDANYHRFCDDPDYSIAIRFYKEVEGDLHSGYSYRLDELCGEEE